MASRGPFATLAPSALAAGEHGVRSRSRLRHAVHTRTEIPSLSLKFIPDFILFQLDFFSISKPRSPTSVN